MCASNQTITTTGRALVNVNARVPRELRAAVRKAGLDLDLSLQDIVYEALLAWLKSVGRRAA